ncbi:hypothetical protein [Vibrio sp.]|uniref:hypothetical protein n=1 Tax=Vibrio sp. TaxID=678 RepID=UPI003AA86D0F
MNIMPRLFIILITTLLYGCTPSIENYINTKFPPIPIEEQRAEALGNFQTNIDNLLYPTIAFQADLNTIKDELMTGVLSDKGITKLVLSADQQLLNAIIDFDIELSEFSDDETVAQYSPRVAGKLSLFFSATLDFARESGKIHVSLIPRLSQFEVDSVIINDSVDVTLIGEVIASVLSQYANNIIGELSRRDVMEIAIPSEYATSFKLSDALKDTNFGEDVTVVIEDKKINLEYTVNSFALLLHNDKIGGMVDFYNPALYEAEGSIYQTLKDNDSFETPYAAYDAALNDMLNETPAPSASWVAIRKSLISTFVSQVLEQGQLCSTVINNKNETFDETIDIPDGTSMSCEIKRECKQNRECKVTPKRDTRNCKACLVKNIFTGGCSVRGNDPVCEVAKAAQNVIYDADAAALKFDCERIKELDRLRCEVEKAGEKALCETAKGVLNAIGRTGNFANVNADVNINGNANLCLTHTTFNSKMSELNAGLRISGRVSTDVNFKFTPLDIAGHFICPFPWTEDYNLTATMTEQSLAIQSKVNLSVEGNKGRYDYSVQPPNVDLVLNPAPEILLLDILGSLNMNMACPIIGTTVAPITVPLRQVVPPLDYKYTVKSRAINGNGNFDLPLITVADKETPFNAQVRDYVFIVYIDE